MADTIIIDPPKQYPVTTLQGVAQTYVDARDTATLASAAAAALVLVNARAPDPGGASDDWVLTAHPVGTAVYRQARFIAKNLKRDFGAKGDGVTDDTAAINAAIADGSPIRCEAGTYLHGTLTPASGMVLLGEHKTRTVFKCTTTGGYGINFASPVSNISVTHIGFTTPDTLAAASAAMLFGAACTDVAIRFCHFSNFANYALRVNAGPNGENTGLRFSIMFNTFTNVYQKRTSSAINSICADDSIIAFNTVYDSGVGGGTLAAIAWQHSHTYAVDDIVTNNGNLYTCTAGGQSAASVGPTGTSDPVFDNTVTWSYQGPVGSWINQQHAIYQSAGCRNLQIMGNKCDKAGGLAAGVTSGPTVFTALAVNFNHIMRTGSPQMAIGGAVSGLQILGNQLQAAAAGTQMLINNGCVDGTVAQNVFDHNGLDGVVSCQVGFAYGGGPQNIDFAGNITRNPISGSASSTAFHIIGAQDCSFHDNRAWDVQYAFLFDTSQSDTITLRGNTLKRVTGNGNCQFIRVSSSASGIANLTMYDNRCSGGHLFDIETGVTNLIAERNTHVNAFSQNALSGSGYSNVRVKFNIIDAYGVSVPTGTNIDVSSNGPIGSF